MEKNSLDDCDNRKSSVSSISKNFDHHHDQMPTTSRMHHLVQLLMRKKSTVSSLPKIIRHREIYGEARQLNRMTCRIRLDQLECPYLVEISGVKRFLDITRECIFIGLSNDSRYAVGLLYSLPSDLHRSGRLFLFFEDYKLTGQDEDETELNIIVFELSAILLKPVKILIFY
ncbi:unnamed protein product [Onchocerca ochengi]|uniref:FERM domain-containing protein n=1 Tax=Onchocerca ochengi TaxID=42157 RepID=A0A182ERN6_ONCOC|nr:unnamed protein product [Onchocerca ochengi]